MSMTWNQESCLSLLGTSVAGVTKATLMLGRFKSGPGVSKAVTTARYLLTPPLTTHTAEGVKSSLGDTWAAVPSL